MTVKMSLLLHMITSVIESLLCIVTLCYYIIIGRYLVILQ